MEESEEIKPEDKVDDIKEAVQVRSEASIRQEILQEIQNLSKPESSTIPAVSEASDLTRRVQTGEITPFEADSKKNSNSSTAGTVGLLDFELYLQRQGELAKKRCELRKKNPKKKSQTESQLPAQKKRKLTTKTGRSSVESTSSTSSTPVPDVPKQVKPPKEPEEDFEEASGSEYVPSDESDDEVVKKRKKKRANTDWAGKRHILDDGDESLYRQRVREVRKQRERADASLRTVDNLFKVPRSVWKRLYDYQKVSVRWLWELHSRGLGGLLGDDMGLGKTVQVLAFFAGLDCSELLSDGGRFRGFGPTLIVCPATLLQQWVQHFHDWCPMMRVVVLHQLGTFQGEVEVLLHSLKSGGVLLTSYTGVLNNTELLVGFRWHYVVLDEGHKIRNPQAKVTSVVKRFSTPHRLLLTGSPMQNSLKELWSLFDFILPGKLGTLDAFVEHCVNPITRGGYSNASSLQEATAGQVAALLKDAITPYMLRRTKSDVKHHLQLPEKTEQVLFCSLTTEQTEIYKEYLKSDEVLGVLHERGDTRARAKLLVALTTLRKICNHPDLFIYAQELDEDDEVEDQALESFGYWRRSGKMVVVRSLLKMWKRQGHRVLLFCQGRQMLGVLEALLQREGHAYLRLDGTTAMGERQKTIAEFNDTSKHFVFLSTTKVGGLGVNLTGADRVVIYDPDWNPATDSQAKERAWRIGQARPVTIYRLITAGTIEEKIYHRQIFKQLLSNRVLEDPRQKNLFRTSDLTELLSFNELGDGESTESGKIFGMTGKPVEKPEKGETKKKNNGVSAMFEGEKVSCLIGRRLEYSKTREESQEVVDDDNYVLNKLFSKTAVNSALEHETILASAALNSELATPMQKFARDAAQESMELVKQSRKWCLKPSWDAS